MGREYIDFSVPVEQIWRLEKWRGLESLATCRFCRAHDHAFEIITHPTNKTEGSRIQPSAGPACWTLNALNNVIPASEAPKV